MFRSTNSWGPIISTILLNNHNSLSAEILRSFQLTVTFRDNNIYYFHIVGLKLKATRKFFSRGFSYRKLNIDENLLFVLIKL